MVGTSFLAFLLPFVHPYFNTLFLPALLSSICPSCSIPYIHPSIPPSFLRFLKSRSRLLGLPLIFPSLHSSIFPSIHQAIHLFSLHSSRREGISYLSPFIFTTLTSSTHSFFLPQYPSVQPSIRL